MKIFPLLLCLFLALVPSAPALEKPGTTYQIVLDGGSTNNDVRLRSGNYLLRLDPSLVDLSVPNVLPQILPSGEAQQVLHVLQRKPILRNVRGFGAKLLRDSPT